LTAARARLGLIALLFALAALAWWSTAVRMDGMDMGPGTALGALGWFLGVWVGMMAAMMLPSAAPTVATYARMSRATTPTAPVVFSAGYLLTWAGAGVAAYTAFELGDALAGDALAWDRAARWVAGGTLLLAAAYELTRSRTPACPSAATRSASSPPRGGMASPARSTWARATAHGASAVAGR
jgi:predicted metal-binding membrane protein